MRWYVSCNVNHFLRRNIISINLISSETNNNLICQLLPSSMMRMLLILNSIITYKKHHYCNQLIEITIIKSNEIKHYLLPLRPTALYYYPPFSLSYHLDHWHLSYYSIFSSCFAFLDHYLLDLQLDPQSVFLVTCHHCIFFLSFLLYMFFMFYLLFVLILSSMRKNHLITSNHNKDKPSHYDTKAITITIIIKIGNDYSLSYHESDQLKVVQTHTPNHILHHLQSLVVQRDHETSCAND